MPGDQHIQCWESHVGARLRLRDKVVFKRQSEWLRNCLAGSVLQIVYGAGHMIHHLATRQVAEAIAHVAAVSAGRACDGQAGAGGRAIRGRMLP